MTFLKRFHYRTDAALALTAVLLLGIAGTALWFNGLDSDDTLLLKKSAFADLPGWTADDQKAALAAFARSCVKIEKLDSGKNLGGFAGAAADWQGICHDLASAPPADARTFIEAHFVPYETWGRNGRQGLFTGYYEPILHGSLTQHDRYQYPIYGRPDDLIDVDLGAFKPSLKGEKIVGRVDGKKLIPYYDRADIEDGALDGAVPEIVWADDPVDVFFLHIQGSGRVKLDDGKTIYIGYSGENGRPYTAIGRELLRIGALTKENVSMPAIRDWLKKHPDEAADVMNVDQSYIFFRTNEDKGGPIGAQGVPLTAERSIAVDRKKIPYGVPIFLDVANPDGEPRLQRLMVAQDTGGAIVGAVRADFFWGAGEKAAHKAGIMKSAGQSWLLLPATVTVPPEKTKQPWWKFWP